MDEGHRNARKRIVVVTLMRLIIVAAGQIKSTPEAALFDTYHDWIERRGRPIGITQLEVQELRSKKSSARAQQDRLDLSQAMDRILTEDPTAYFFCWMSVANK